MIWAMFSPSSHRQSTRSPIQGCGVALRVMVFVVFEVVEVDENSAVLEINIIQLVDQLAFVDLFCIS